MRQFITLTVLLFAIFAQGEAARPKKMTAPDLNRINIIDNNGFSETISNPDRLKQYQNVDFFRPQPYQKVLRIYQRDPKGNVHAYINSYYENGQPKQFLEVVNNRAYGNYYEWHPDGTLKIETFVVGGQADIDPSSQNTWLFEGEGRVYDEKGRLQAALPYCKGMLEGISLYYHPNGKLWKRVPFRLSEINGNFEIYTEDGKLLQTVYYSKGIKEGKAIRYWPNGSVSSDEVYCAGLLQKGVYCDIRGEPVCSVIEGTGTRALFGKNEIAELHQYQNGRQDGQVLLLNAKGDPTALYHLKEGKKHGEEIIYYPKTLFQKENRPKLSVNWFQGAVQGTVKTWYENGIIESQREMSGNGKTGLSTAWFADGSLMMVEEYEQNRLIKGKYYRPKDSNSVSQVMQGQGTAMIYDADGNFVQKISYEDGWPVQE